MVLPRPGLPRLTAGGTHLAHLLDAELVTDKVGGITLHLLQSPLQDTGAGTQTGLGTEGAYRGALARVKGRLLAKLVEFVHRLGAPGFRCPVGGGYARLLRARLALTGLR